MHKTGFSSPGFAAFLQALMAGLSRQIPATQRVVSPCELSRHLARDIGWTCD